ncbi:hypothetical protein PIB30_078509 [Stylosanthes scabra]|uniref:Uncharacterized protein n=1 Tax=Stylosanthes scabra TaxID=79078 RepID=A0ABU6YNG2_9FABA|nr:hypothetical protein [Stylosanthes scabra]
MPPTSTTKPSNFTTTVVAPPNSKPPPTAVSPTHKKKSSSPSNRYREKSYEQERRNRLLAVATSWQQFSKITDGEKDERVYEDRGAIEYRGLREASGRRQLKRLRLASPAIVSSDLDNKDESRGALGGGKVGRTMASLLVDVQYSNIAEDAMAAT